MRVPNLLVAIALVSGLPLPASAFEVYLTNDPGLADLGPPVLPEGFGPVAYSVVVNNGTVSSSAGEECNGAPDTVGDEICMYDLTFRATGNCEITSFAGVVPQDIVDNGNLLPSTILRFNGGVPSPPDLSTRSTVLSSG